MEVFAWLTIAAVVISFVVATIFDINLGFLCIITGFLASILAGKTGTEIVKAISPDYLILLLGILFMFTIANKNGTIEKLCMKLLMLVKGNRFIMPFAFALLGGFICGIGAGGAATSSLMCGPTAGMAKKARIDPMLMSTTTMHGIFAGQFTPVSALAIAILAYLAKQGINVTGSLMVWNMIIELIMAVVAFAIFGGFKLLKSKESFSVDLGENVDTRFNLANWVTLAAIAFLVYDIIALKLNTGITALLLGTIMLLAGGKKGIKEAAIIKAIPWGTAFQVLGAIALLQVMSDAGGTTLIVNAIKTLNLGSFGILLLFGTAALVSFYALSSPVILAILPLGIGLCKATGMEALIPGMAIGVCIAGTMVDISPVSINGALFTSSVAGLAETDGVGKKMFNNLFYYGLAMIAASSILCYLLFIVFGVAE